MIARSDIMAVLVDRHDWSATAIGPAERWSPVLRATVDLVLAHDLPMALLWGPDLVQIHNDGFRAILGDGSTGVLGQPARYSSPETFGLDQAIRHRVGAGKTVTVEDTCPADPSGAARFRVKYHPVREGGTVAGILLTAVEMAPQDAAEPTVAPPAAPRDGEQRQATLLRVSDAVRTLADPDAIQGAAARILGEAVGAAWVYYGEYAASPPRMTIRSDYTRDGGPSVQGTYPIESFEMLAELRQGQTVTVADTLRSTLFSEASRARWGRVGMRSMIAVPIVKRGELIAALVVADIEPRDWTAHAALVEDIAERTWSAVGRARSDLALRESEQRLQMLVEGVPQLVWRATGDGRWTWASSQWSAYTGQSEPDSHGLGWLDAVHPDDREVVVERWGAAADHGEYHADYRLHHAGERRHRWFRTRASPVRDGEGRIVEWLGTSTDVDDLRRLKRRQEVLLAELQHRVRNILTIVRSVFARTVEARGTVEEVADHFKGRLDSLARTQVVATQSASGLVDLENLIRDELLSVGATDSPALTIEGPEVLLNSKEAESLGLAIHELTTNSLKYGALKLPAATLDIRWTTNMDYGDERRLDLTWSEQGVPAVSLKPARYGFGRELIEEALPYRLGAETRLDFRGGGVRCTISTPLHQEDVSGQRHDGGMDRWAS